MDKTSLSRTRVNRIGGRRTASAPAAPQIREPERPSPRYGWLVRLAIGLGILGWLVWRIEWTPILETFARVQVGYCVLALLLYCLAQVVSWSVVQPPSASGTWIPARRASAWLT